MTPAPSGSADDEDYGIDLQNPYHALRLEQTLRMLGLAPLRVLDVGCGRGQFAREMSIRHRVVGLDRNWDAVSVAASERPHAHWVVGDGCALPFRAGAFDAVVLNNIVEHVADPGALLREAASVARGEGGVVVSTPNRLHPRNVLRLLFRRALEIRHVTHVQEFTPGEMRRLAAREGLTQTDMLYDPPPLIEWTDRRAPFFNVFIAALRLLRPRGFCYNAYYRFMPSGRTQGEPSARQNP